MNLTEFKKSALSERVAIYVPSTIDVNKPFDNSLFVAAIAEKFSDMFGGATQEKKIGYYISDNGQFVKEAIVIIYSFTDRATLENNFGTVIEIATDLKKTMGQEAISIEINNCLNFV